MKLGIFGDLHLTNRAPIHRIDDYFATQLAKFNEGLDIFKREGCTYVLQVGDFFDAPTASNLVISTIISLLRERNLVIYCCYGQHDISGHSEYTLRRSPLKVLESAGVVKILDEIPFDIHMNPAFVSKDMEYLEVYGSSFGTEVPKPSIADSYNILVTHRMVGDRPLYPGDELPSPKKFLQDNPEYNLVLVGDYHYRFIAQESNRTIINPGCLVRKSTNVFDLEHRPAVVVFDLQTQKSEVFELNFKPVEECFDLTKKEKKDNESLLTFIQNLKTEKMSGASWKTILLQVSEERKISQEVRDMLDRMMVEGKEKIGKDFLTLKKYKEVEDDITL